MFPGAAGVGDHTWRTTGSHVSPGDCSLEPAEKFKKKFFFLVLILEYCNKNLCAHVRVCLPSNGRFQKSPGDSNTQPGLKTSPARKLPEGGRFCLVLLLFTGISPSA